MNPNLKRTLAGVMVLACITFAGCVVAGQPAKASAKQVNPSLQRELDQQLVLARKEGLITSLKEMKAWVPAVPDELNAAPFYRKLSYGTKLSYPRSESLDRRESEAVRKAHEILMERADDLKLLDQAVQRPKAWFDRDYLLGNGLVPTEYAKLKAGARLLLLRSAVARSEGHSTLAFKDIRRVLRMADHLRQEKTLLAILVDRDLRTRVRQQLVRWAGLEPSGAIWTEALESMARSWPQITEKDCVRPLLYEALAGFDFYPSEDAFEVIGVPEPDHNRKIEPAAAAKGKLLVVRSFRMIWTELDKGKSARKERLEQAKNLYWQGIKCDPNVEWAYDYLTTGEAGNPFWTIPARLGVCDKLLTQAAVHFLKSEERDERVSMAGFISPADGKPLRITKRKGDFIISCVDRDFGYEWPELRIPGDVLAKAEPTLPE